MYICSVTKTYIMNRIELLKESVSMLERGKSESSVVEFVFQNASTESAGNWVLNKIFKNK